MNIESIVDKEYKGINLELISKKQCLILSFFSMLRIKHILKYISTNEKFEKITKLEGVWDKVENRLFNNIEFNNIELDKYLDICEEIIPIIEDYDIDELGKKEESIMNLTYSIIEEVFYFISIQSKTIEEINKDSCKSFIFLPATIIESYLEDYYLSNGCNEDEIQKTINSNKYLIDEINRIKDDLVNIDNRMVLNNKILDYSSLSIIDLN